MKSFPQKIGFYAALALMASASLASAGGVVNTCDEASLRAAVAGGGLVTFACSGTITLSNTVAITNDTTLDAAPSGVTISGGSAVRLFTVNSNVTFRLVKILLVDGLAKGTNGLNGATLGAVGGPAGPGEGGAIQNEGGVVTAADCSFLRNKAQGGQGGTGNAAVNGISGIASGGAIFVKLGSLFATNCTFAMNWSLGGTGAVTTGSFSVASEGADARGGAIYTDGGAVQLVNCLVVSNRSNGGPGRRFNTVGVGVGGFAYGGSLYSSNGQVSLVRSTVSQNKVMSEATRNSYGGAIYQDGGNLHLIESLLESNTVTGGRTISIGGGFIPGGAHAIGGAVCVNSGSAWITNSTLSLNGVQPGEGASGPMGPNVPGTGFGGAVFNAGTLFVANSTIHRNQSLAGYQSSPFGQQGNGWGGGLFNSGTMTLDYVTVADNSVLKVNHGVAGTGTVLGGGIFSTNGTATIHATIVANNSPTNCFANFTDNGFNLCSDASANFTGTGSLNSTDPKLGPFDDYGGPTPTLVLLGGSPAIDGGGNANCLATDQRGHARPYGAACDIGAFESSAPFLIRGRVSGSTLTNEVVVSHSADSDTTVAGIYSLQGPAAAYTVTPAHADYLFVPSNRVVTVGPDQLNVDFKAYRWNALSVDGVSNNVLHQVFAGTNGLTYRILVSSNLTDWTPSATNVMGPSNYFELFDSMILPKQFFRVVTP